MRAIFIIIVGLILTACSSATTQKYDSLLNAWLNKPEVELVSSWGAPDNVYTVANQKFISYYSQHNQYIPRTVYRYQPFFTAGWPYYDPFSDVSYQVISKICKTTFTIENNLIIAWSHQGDGCVTR